MFNPNKCFFFFLIIYLFIFTVKSKYYKEQKGPEDPRSTQDVNKRDQKKANKTVASKKL